MPTFVDGVLYKRVETQLTSSEFNVIMDVAPFVTIGTLHLVLKSRWREVGFNKPLLYHLKNKAKTSAFGKDKHTINKFMECGEKVKGEGGIFNVTFDQSMNMKVFLQTLSMRRFALFYDDFMILDGSFCTS